MRVSISFIANSGIIVSIGEKKLLIDALFREKVQGFSSPLLNSVRTIMRSFENNPPDAVFVSHCHGDHFSADLISKAMSKWERTKFFLPIQLDNNPFYLDKNRQDFHIDNLDLHFFRLPHDGSPSLQCSHYGVVIKTGNTSILYPGDCKICSPVLSAEIRSNRIDLAVLPFPWVTKSSGRDFICNTLRPDHLIVCHLPFEKDDCFGFIPLANKGLQLVTTVKNKTLLSEPGQTILLDVEDE